MSGQIYIYSVGNEHTTARYFENLLHAAGQNYTYCDSLPDLKKINSDDLFFFVDPAPDWPIGLERIPCLSVAYLIDVHQELGSRINFSRFFDVVLVVQKDFVSAFQKVGHPNVHWLPLACDPETHCHPHDVRQFDVGFVGKLGRKETWRNDVLTTVLPRYKTNDYKKFYPPRVMADVYGQSKIVFNASINGDVNMRAFEALASRALLITDRIKNGLEELFVEGVHYVGYSTIDEAIDKIDYYLANPTEREKIATAGQEKVINSNTYRHRWTEVSRLVTTSAKNAPARKASNFDLGRLYAEIFVSLRKPWRIHSVLRQYGPSIPLLSNFCALGGDGSTLASP